MKAEETCHESSTTEATASACGFISEKRGEERVSLFNYSVDYGFRDNPQNVNGGRIVGLTLFHFEGMGALQSACYPTNADERKKLFDTKRVDAEFSAGKWTTAPTSKQAKSAVKSLIRKYNYPPNPAHNPF